jgi:hypothetical protein
MWCGELISAHMDGVGVGRDGRKALPVVLACLLLVVLRRRCSDESLSGCLCARPFVSSAESCYRWLRVRRGR